MPSFYHFNLLLKTCRYLFFIGGILFLPILVNGKTNKPAGKHLYFQSQGKIAGRVYDAKGESLPGASVHIVGQTTGAQSSIDGSFSFAAKPGTYTVEVSFISYETKRISDVVVKSGEVTSLNIVLNAQETNLKEVVITATTFRKASAEGLYTKQKNASNITNGISADQIAKTPDANVGQSLKRISGLATFDNKYVIVRGISERYNVATLDGTPLPSTDYTRRNFSFDLIPSEMIESVIVHKTVTPDLPIGFAGGMVQVTTRDIPTKNFISFTVGTGFNDQSTGKDFLSSKRGKYDYLGFDDGTRKMADYFRISDGNASSKDNKPFTQADYDFSKQFTNNWGLYKYKAQPNQNYSFAIGQSYNINKSDRVGFIAALNYRNTQTITNIENKRDIFTLAPVYENLFGGGAVGSGNIYNFNTTFGGILNVGYRTKTFQLSSRNTYSRVFSNPLTNVFGFDNDAGDILIGPQYAPSTQRIVTEPDFLTLLQNKLQGEHQLGSIKLNWDVSRTSIDRQRKDMLRRELRNDDQEYGNYFHDSVDPDAVYVFPLSRQTFNLKETDYNWTLSGSRQIIKEGDFVNTVKIGYIGFSKNQKNNFVTAYLKPGSGTSTLDTKFLIQDTHTANDFGPGKLVYQVDPFGLDEYEGNSSFHAGYAMVDQKLWGKLRFVGGVRFEYFKLQLIDDAFTSANALITSPDVVLVANERDKDKAWQILPAANLTYAVNDQFNLRAAYSQSMVRPEFNERSLASNFNSDLLADVSGGIVVSTKTSSYDLRAEWYPGLGEIISIGGFYKYLDRPLELTKQGGQALYAYNNSKSAKSYGIEAEFRRKLSFINDAIPLLDKMIFFANATVLKSKVVAVLPPIAVQKDPVNNPNIY
ncbi:MAG: TonB-dependent receptor, partial [Sphingobacteriales bacterium]